MNIDVDSKGYLRFTPSMRRVSVPKVESPGMGKGAVTPHPLTVAGRLSRVFSNQNMTATKEQVKLALAATMAVADAVRELGEVNEGVLYSVLMGKMDLASFERLLGVLVNAGVVERKPIGVLKWVGPNRDAAALNVEEH